MARPPLPLGTHGKIKAIQLGPGRWRARTKYRDYDGVTRPVERVGSSKTAAENTLKEALRDRGRVERDGEITADSKVGSVAAVWLRDLDESDRATRTKLTYVDTRPRILAPAVEQLWLRDMRVSRVERVIREIRHRNGPGAAQHARAVLSGILGLAVRHDAMDSNPVRDLTPATRKSKRVRVDLDEASLTELRAYLGESRPAKKYDLIDVVDVLSGLGCRIGELLALDWEKIDDEAGTIAIEGTVIRVPKVGLIVQLHTKSDAGMRTIIPPRWLIELLYRRHLGSFGKWVFPSSAGTLRDPDNTRKQLRATVKDTDWEGLHPHAFRHLVATRLDAAGLSAREIADYLGHERPSMTQVYLTRKAGGAAASTALTQFSPAQA